MSADYKSRTVKIKRIGPVISDQVRLNGRLLRWEKDDDEEIGRDGDFIDIQLKSGGGHLQFKISFEETADDNVHKNSSCCSSGNNAVPQCSLSSCPRPAGKARHSCCQRKKTSKSPAAPSSMDHSKKD
jgi:hypothetical protein